MSVVRKTLLVVSLLASGAAYAGTPGWSVSEASGPVYVAKPGVSKTSVVARGAALVAGDIVSTGKGGRAVIVRGGEYLTVAPNTKLQLTEPKAGAFTQIVQSFGNVVFKIQKKTTPHFQVNTPYLAAVVKGTTFSVTVTPAGASVQVTEGLVQVASLDGLASRFVSPGEIGMISASAPGQLSVLGTPNAPSGGAAVIGAAPAAPAPTADAPVETAAPVSEIAEVRIASPIGEGNVNLAAQTGGIVSGNSSLAQAAMIEAVAAAAPAATESVAATDLASVTPPVAPVAEAPVVEAPSAVVAEASPAQPLPPVVMEVAATPPVEVAVVEAPPVEVAVAAPPVAEVPPAVEAPVLVAVNTTPPAPVEASVSTPIPAAEVASSNPNLIVPVGDSSDDDVEPVSSGSSGNSDAGSSGSGSSSSNSGGSNSGSTASGSSNAGSSNSGSSNSGSNNASSVGVTASNNAPGRHTPPMSLAEFLEKIKVAIQQGKAGGRGN